MGCDIHVMIEKMESGRWLNVDNWRINPYKKDGDDEPDMVLIPIYEERNYELFSFLAGVRNYGGNPSFDFDRGIPANAHEATRREYERWGEDAHTPGYATLAELKEKIATVKTVRRSGAVTKEQAEKYRTDGEDPSSWCQGVGCWHGISPEYEDRYEWLSWFVEPTSFKKLINAIEERKRDVFWIFDPADDDGSLDALIRIVFWFDN